MENQRKTLEEYLKLQYPFRAIADPDGGWVIVYPDLPGCLSQVDRIEDIGPMAEEARQGWIEVSYERGHDIPLPSYPEEFSGKFNLRIPRSLHRELTDEADREGVSLNQYITMLLSRRDALQRVERRLTQLEARFEGRRGNGGHSTAGSPLPARNREPFAGPYPAAPDLRETTRQSRHINEPRAEYDDKPAAPLADKNRRGRAKRSASEDGTT